MMSVSRVFARMSSSYAARPEQKIAGIFGALMNRGQGKEGVREGPNAIRGAGLFKQLKECGIKAIDYGDVEIQAVASDDEWKKVKYCRTVASGCKQIAEKTELIIKEHGIPIMLGGDHAAAMGSIFGHAAARRHFPMVPGQAPTTSEELHAPLAVLWIDAHGDINTPQTTATGNLHGCPVSFLLHEMDPSIPHDLPGFEWLKPCLTANRIAYIGLRSLDHDEMFVMEKLNIKYWSMEMVDEIGIKKCLEQALAAIDPKGDLPLHLSFDIDALDPSEAASTGTPVMGGLTLREGLQIAEFVHATGRLSAMDLVEVNPELGTPHQKDKTTEAACSLIAAALGKPRAGTPAPPGYELPLPI